ncbi:MAG: hypothetical protein HKN48_00925 [Flavobacteriaceae bacterium]|nr:hypothetical protein [Flavobacteriaceae bacterium]
MKIYLNTYCFITCFLFNLIGIAQVGIGTTNPQEDLHVAGNSATIRIESLNSTNNSTYNNGVDLSPAFVDGNGDITIGNGTGPSGQEPLNFLLEMDNFLPDDPYLLGVATGTAVNSNDLGQTMVDGQIGSVTFTAPQNAMVEIKYGITLIVVGNDITAGPPYFYVTFDQAVSMMTYFKVDLNSDGLSGSELTKDYGQKGQYYSTNNQGSAGYPYMNGQAYFTVPAGTHTVYFYGRVNDSPTHYTSVGFGGAQDYLKIRVYN